MPATSRPSLAGTLKHLVLALLAASGAAARPGRREATALDRREACPTWPDVDAFTYDAKGRCRYVYPPEEALGRRWRAEGGREAMADALDRMARLGCVSDPLSAHFFHRAYHELPVWQGASRAQIFSGDTILLKSFLPTAAPTSPAQFLGGATQRIWQTRRVAFVAVVWEAQSREQVEAWAVAGGAGRDARVFFQGARAGPLGASEIRRRLPEVADPEAQVAVSAGRAPRLLGLEEPRIAAAGALAHALYLGDEEMWVERALDHVVHGGAGLLDAWRAAFATAHTDVQALCAEFMALTYQERMAPSRRFVATLATAFDREDPEVADALRCLVEEDALGAARIFGRQERLLGAPRERAWAETIRATVDRYPEAPILVVGETRRLMGLRARWAEDGALPPWPPEGGRRWRGRRLDVDA